MPQCHILIPAPRTSPLYSRKSSPHAPFGPVQQSRFSPCVGPSVNASRIARILPQSLPSRLRQVCHSGIQSSLAFPTIIKETPPRARERFCASFLRAIHALPPPSAKLPLCSIAVKPFIAALLRLRSSALSEPTRMDRCNGTTILINPEVLWIRHALHRTYQSNRKNRNQRSKSLSQTKQLMRNHCLPVPFSRKPTTTTQHRHRGTSIKWTAYRPPQPQARW